MPVEDYAFLTCRLTCTDSFSKFDDVKLTVKRPKGQKVELEHNKAELTAKGPFALEGHVKVSTAGEYAIAWTGMGHITTIEYLTLTPDQITNRTTTRHWTIW